MELRSDQEARQIAYDLVTNEGFENVEVWRGNTQLCSLTAADSQSPSHKK